MTAAEASVIADRAARRRTIAHDTLRYRITEIDHAFAPGAIVTTPVTEGRWRVEQWEWQADGVMLDLVAVPPSAPVDTTISDAGRANQALDLQPGPTSLAAFELPWDGVGDPTKVKLQVAASSQSAGWTGASLFVQVGDGQLAAIGSTGRRRAVLGRTLTRLPAGTPLMFDAHATVDVALVPQDAALADATWAQLMRGSNLSYLGSELIQFSRAERLANGTWRISGLLRGRGGTEAAISNHASDEPFVLIDDSLTMIDPSDVTEGLQIAALGLGDPEVVTTEVINRGIGLRPLAPVHGQAKRLADGGLQLDWIRRSRGGWAWLNELDVPLNEPQELWQIAYGTADAVNVTWNTTEPRLRLTSAQVSALGPATEAHRFSIRQVGRTSLSLPLIVTAPE